MKVFKSIMSLRPRLLISVLIFSITVNMMSIHVIANDEFKEIIQDLPAVSDFDSYLSALENVVDFCLRHKHYVDLNLEFGLFLIDVNLKPVMEQKRITIPLETRSRMEKIFVKNEALGGYFHLMVQRNQNDTHIGQNQNQNIKLSRIFYNATTWPKLSDAFNLNLLNETNIYSPEQLKEIFGKWEEYYINVIEFRGVSPAESDRCMAFMVKSSPVRFNRRFQLNCLTPLRCRQFVQEGTEFGYGLTHRLLLLIVARFYRRCVVFSEREDKLKTDTYCKKSFNEAEYIASNNFLLPDLFYEQMALCGLLGHAQFIRKSWLENLLQFQTSEGCFTEKIATGDFDENQMREDKNDEWEIERHLDIMNGQCNGHFTGVAAAALSNALRFILEDYY